MGLHGRGKKPIKAYENMDFINSSDGRLLRIMSEMIEPKRRFSKSRVRDSIAFFGSARLLSREDAEIMHERAELTGDDDKIRVANTAIKMSRYFEESANLAEMLTSWSIQNNFGYYLCSGGGPGIMEAANLGASRVTNGKSIGLNISLPFEQEPNPYITPELNFEFNYFFVRKFWFTYLAKAIVVFPGGFGTLDEFFEILTLIQTGKTTKTIPIVLYGKDFWSNLVNFDFLVEQGVISKKDLDLFVWADTPQEAFDYLTAELKLQRRLHAEFYR